MTKLEKLTIISEVVEDRFNRTIKETENLLPDERRLIRLAKFEGILESFISSSKAIINE